MGRNTQEIGYWEGRKQELGQKESFSPQAVGADLCLTHGHAGLSLTHPPVPHAQRLVAASS